MSSCCSLCICTICSVLHLRVKCQLFVACGVFPLWIFVSWSVFLQFRTGEDEAGKRQQLCAGGDPDPLGDSCSQKCSSGSTSQIRAQPFADPISSIHQSNAVPANDDVQVFFPPWLPIITQSVNSTVNTYKGLNACQADLFSETKLCPIPAPKTCQRFSWNNQSIREIEIEHWLCFHLLFSCEKPAPKVLYMSWKSNCRQHSKERIFAFAT